MNRPIYSSKNVFFFLVNIVPTIVDFKALSVKCNLLIYLLIYLCCFQLPLKSHMCVGYQSEHIPAAAYHQVL